MWKQQTGDLENRWRSVDVEYSGMKEIVWGVWKERENMNADMKWLDNPEVFKVNQLESHSDHCYYLDYSDMKKKKSIITVIKWSMGVCLQQKCDGKTC